MAELELRTIDGKTERRELSRRQSLSIGKLPYNDIAIPGEDVSSLHCRIAWNKSAYEVTAGGKDGVDLNGKLVDHAVLKPGDTMRIGAVDLVFRDSSDARADRDAERQRRKSSDKAGADKPGKSSDRKKDRAKDDDDENELSLFQGPVIAESLAEMIAQPEILPDSSDELSGLMLSRNLSQGETLSRGGAPVGGGAGPAPIAAELKEVRQKVSAALAADRVRPGDQDILKSPLVLGLGGGALIALLVTATIWFLMGRQVAHQHYDRAVQEFGESKFSQAIATYESFLEKYPAHPLRTDALVGLGKARIQKELAGATPSWKRGLEQLEAFLAEHRDAPEFKTLQPAVAQFAENIALGSAKTAEQVKDPELLIVSADATRRLEQFGDPQNPPAAALEQIRVATEQANAAIRKQRTFDEAFAVIDRAIGEKHPITVLDARAKLLQTYPDLANQKRVRDALQQAISLEKAVVTVADLDEAASAQEAGPAAADCVIPVDHSRSRTDESASGRYVYALAHDSCFALDAVTGEVAWRKLTGVNPPFFPVLTSGAQPGLLFGESRPASLTLRHAETGALIWRQPFAEPITGAPLIHEGEIFIAVRGQSLFRLDLDTGRLKERLTFSQDIVGPPAVAPDGEHLFVAGESALVYTLSIRPWKVTAVTFSSHAAQAVKVPLLTMGRLVLMCDNDRLDSCRLRVWDAAQPDALTEANPIRIEGQVLDRPVLRGAQLVVVATGERLQAFSVSDDPEKKGLAPIGSYKIQDGYQGPMQLALGPDQQFWLASSAFRRFQVSNDSLRADPNMTAPGIATQPLQIIGDLFFVARRPPYARAAIVTQVDRERMAGSWRAVVGASLLAWTPSRNDGIVAVSEAGTVFALGASRLQQGGIDLRAGTPLDIPPDVIDPLGAVRLSDGRLALWCGGPQARLWLINSAGQVESEYKLDAALTAAPVLLKQGLVLPQPGRLKWLSVSRDGPRVQDFVAPVEEGAVVRWSFLTALDDREFIACDANGRLARIQIRQDDVVHLAEVAKFTLPQPVEIPPVRHENDLLVADASGTLFRLDSRSFDVKGRRTFSEPIRGVWTESADGFVQLAGGGIHCIGEGDGLPDRWSAAPGGFECLDAPVRRGEQLIWAGRSGLILTLDAATGKEAGATSLPQSLGLGLLRLGEALYAAAIDGAIYRVPAPQGGQP